MAQKSRAIFSVVFSIVVFFVMFSCKLEPDQLDTVDEKEYFPIKTGWVKVYQVKEVLYLLNGTKIENSYQVKQKITDIRFQDTKSSIYGLEKYKRKDDKFSWVLDSVGTVEVYRNRILQVFSNVPLQKMVFPVSYGYEWDINQYNLYAGSFNKSYYKDIAQSTTVLSKTFNNTLNVVHSDKSSFIDKNYFVETYAFGVGLIASEQKVVEYCQDASCIENCSKGDCKISNGNELTYQLLESYQE